MVDFLLFLVTQCTDGDCTLHRQGMQHRMISVVNVFRIFEIIIFCFVVAICDLVHAVEAMHDLP